MITELFHNEEAVTFHTAVVILCCYPQDCYISFLPHSLAMRHFDGVSAALWPCPEQDRCSHSFSTVFLSLLQLGAKTGLVTA